MPQADRSVFLELAAQQSRYEKSAEEKEYGDAEAARHEALEPGVSGENEQETDRSQPVERRYVADRRRHKERGGTWTGAIAGRS